MKKVVLCRSGCNNWRFNGEKSDIYSSFDFNYSANTILGYEYYD